MHSQQELVAHLVALGVLRSQTLIEAFLATDRALFVPESCRSEAYEDFPLPIGYGQTISQPYTVAFMLELLQPKADDDVLDIGSGSGWTTALLSRCCRSVTGLERIDALVDFGRENLRRASVNANARIMKASPELGIPGHRFDRILVSAAAETLPASLIGQLKEGGRLVIPVSHAIVAVENRNGTFLRHAYDGFSFVPLL